jgi:polysaccharide export outer membrane protein
MQKGKAPDMAMKENDVVYVPFSFLKNAELEVTALAASATSAMITLK